MSKTITNDEGVEEVVYTQAELDAMRSDDKKHMDEKLDEFKKGKTAQELEKEENKKAIEEIKKEAEKATGLVVEANNKARNKVVDFLVSSIVGEDPELRKKLTEELATVEAGFKAQNKDITDDKVIQEMLIKAAAMAGITGRTPNFPMGGGMAPSFIKKENEGVSDAEHETFLKATGYPKDPVKKE